MCSGQTALEEHLKAMPMRSHHTALTEGSSTPLLREKNLPCASRSCSLGAVLYITPPAVSAGSPALQKALSKAVFPPGFHIS